MKKRTIIILVVLGGLGILVGLDILKSRTANSEPVRINLPAGDFSMLCNHLDQKDIETNTTFHLFARLLKLDQSVKPGSYIVEPHMKQLALVRKLRNGQQDPIRLTIGKFRTPGQLNDYLNKKLMHNDFSITLDSFYLIRPNTYEFYWTVSPDAFMQRMEREYRKVENDATQDAAASLSTSLFPLSTFREAIILASIIEEETNNNQEKPLVASVYLNRLRKGMPLQADPTVKYAVGDFTLRRILNKHLAEESPFNTYLHIGLPPAPICLPSASSVDAVLNAPQTNYLYFCASPDLDGTHRFAATLAEHNRNAAAYHAALNRNGIKH